MNSKILSAIVAMLAMASPVVAASLSSHDLYPLNNPGNGFTQVFPTGFHPAGDGLVGGQGTHGDNFSHAFLWSSSANPIDLNPAGFTNSYLYAAGTAHQVGYAANNRTGLGHAYLWSGTAASGIDLTPVGYSSAVAYAASATRQVGSIAGAANNFNDHAVLWSGSAASFIDLNPTGFATSKAINLDATHQVGSGSGPVTGNAEHALLWTDGSSVVDLNPTGFASSQAQAVGGGREAGFGFRSVGGDPQALLWTGASPAASVLTPSGFTGSIAYATTADAVAGFVLGNGSISHASYWSNSAASFVDLHALLGAGFINSQAYSIGADGTIYGTALASNNTYHAVSWTPIPDPNLLGDFDRDQQITAADLPAMLQALTNLNAYQAQHNQLSDEQLRAIGDLDHSGVVDNADIQPLLDLLAKRSAGRALVPEPSTFLLAIVAWVILVSARFFDSVHTLNSSRRLNQAPDFKTASESADGL